MLTNSIQWFQSYLAENSVCAPDIFYSDFKIGAKYFKEKTVIESRKKLQSIYIPFFEGCIEDIACDLQEGAKFTEAKAQKIDEYNRILTFLLGA